MKKFGPRVYDGTNQVKREVIGFHTCPVCQEQSRLIKQRGGGFENVLSICDKNHTVELENERGKGYKGVEQLQIEQYKVGDRIRDYESTFGKDSVLRLDSYTEGVVIKSYPDLIDYQLDFRVDKCVSLGHEIKAPAWIIGSIHRGVDHSSTQVIKL